MLKLGLRNHCLVLGWDIYNFNMQLKGFWGFLLVLDAEFFFFVLGEFFSSPGDPKKGAVKILQRFFFGGGAQRRHIFSRGKKRLKLSYLDHSF